MNKRLKQRLISIALSVSAALSLIAPVNAAEAEKAAIYCAAFYDADGILVGVQPIKDDSFCSYGR